MSGSIGLGAIGDFVIGSSPIGGTPSQAAIRTLSQTNPGVFSAQVVAFTPSQLTAFRFQATLDGASYDVVVTWNVFGRRWYVSVFDQNNVRILTLPMIGSPPDYDISLTAGYFTSTLVFRAATQSFEINP